MKIPWYWVWGTNLRLFSKHWALYIYSEVQLAWLITASSLFVSLLNSVGSIISSADNCLKNTDGKWCQDNWQTEHWEIPDPGTDCGAQGQDNLPGGTGREKHQKSLIAVTVLCCCLITLQGGQSSLLFQNMNSLWNQRWFDRSAIMIYFLIKFN